MAARYTRTVLVAVLWSLSAVPLQAQVVGVSVLSPGRPNTGGRLAWHFLGGVAREAPGNLGASWLLRSSYTIGSRITVSAAAAHAPVVDHGKEWQAMGEAAVAIIKTKSKKVMPTLSVVGGVGTILSGDFDASTRTLALPVDLLINLNGPFAEPFISPRFQRQLIGGAAQDQTRSGFGVSYGLRIVLAVGIGFVVAVDHSHYAESTRGSVTTRSATHTSGGVGVRLALPNH